MTALRVELAATRGDETRQVHASGEAVTVGRADSCDVAIADKGVSREHCRLELRERQLFVVDLDSANGTWCGGERVAERCIGAGDAFRVGHTELRVIGFEILVPPAPARRGAARDAVRDEVADEAVDREIGGYRVLGRLGRGGFGVVYRARDARSGREVALKVVNREQAPADLDVGAAFEREAGAAAALDHEGLVRVHDVGVDGDCHYLAMELVPGGSVAARIKSAGPLAWREAVSIAIEVAGALAHAHGRGYAHGDVKPANVLLTADGRAKLADLGLVRETGQTRTRAGTKAFLAPELIRNQPVDERADLYALGCTLFCMLTGRVVFDRQSAREILHAHLHDRPPSLRQAGAEAPSDLDRIVHALLAKDPADRPQRASDVVAALTRILRRAEPPVTITKRAASRRRRRMDRERQGLGGHGIAIVVAVAVLLAFAVWAVSRL